MQNKFKKYTIYQIYLRSFQDNNGDGIGDLEGVIQRLPLISQLGIDLIWLSPFYRSHQYDNGYDVDDYKSIDPLFGDFEVFERLVNKAKELNIAIMLDMVFNHSSTHHEWFQKALNGDKDYQDYYIFKDNEGHVPTNWESKFGGSAWKYVDSLDKYYLHLFHEKQADLNWKNPKIMDEMVDILKFWKDKGVTGFRFDVVNLISKPDVYEDDFIGDGRRFYTDGPNVTKYLSELFSRAGIEDCVTVGELSSTTIEKSTNYTNPKNGTLDMAFNFHHLKVDYKDGDKWSVGNMDLEKFFSLLDEWQSKVQAGGGWSAWFMNNHDQPRALSRYGDDINYHYELATSLATLTHLMRGTPYVYQGEEIGMRNPNYDDINDYKDVESLNYYDILIKRGYSENDAIYTLKQRSRDNGRTPIRWDDSENGDFSDATPWIKVNQDASINYLDALEDENSIFYYYKKLIDLRKSHLAIQDGKYENIYFDDKIYAFSRSKDDEKVIVLMNFSTEELTLGNQIVKVLNDNEYEVLINNYEEFDNTRLRPYQSIVLLRR
ncbi:MAG: alpha,alpha-phosphotrehalase [Tissierellia bacterium]|nr:alpha,alpha-phosphotrehalase [Tissierellia bacterium]